MAAILNLPGSILQHHWKSVTHPAWYGINRFDGRRTAPLANNRQTVDVYVALREGVYLYNAKDHRPDLVAPVDVLAATGSQPFVPQAPLNLGSGGLSTVIRATVDRVALAKALHLRPEQNIMLSQTVGYPSRTPAGGKTVD